MRETGNYLGYKIACGSFEPCESCTLAKAQQKNVPKIGTGEKATERNGQWYTNQLQLKSQEGVPGKKSTWNIIVDESTPIVECPFLYHKRCEDQAVL